MGDLTAATRGNLLDWGVASRPLPGEQTSGDLHYVEESREGALVAVVDGLGHGEEAALAARRATAALRVQREASVVSLMSRCHRALVGTRGAVVSLGVFEAGRRSMAWLGIGNVEGVQVRATDGGVARKSLLLRGGVVGHELPALEASEYAVLPGDLLVLATDGIRPEFASALDPSEEPQRLADRILADYAKDTDDGLVLVARYRGT